MADVRGRKQKLALILLTKVKPALTQLAKSRDDAHLRFSPTLTNMLGAHSVRYWFVSAVGWLCWTGATTVSLMARLHIAAAYMLLMPLTGLPASSTHGGKPRRLLDERPSPF
jgi:hypothetical protein